MTPEAEAFYAELLSNGWHPTAAKRVTRLWLRLTGKG